jgi:hypothetical protein
VKINEEAIMIIACCIIIPGMVLSIASSFNEKHNTRIFIFCNFCLFKMNQPEKIFPSN